MHARSTAEWEQISRHVGRDLDADGARRGAGPAHHLRIAAFVEDLAREHLAAARAVTDDLGIPAELIESLTADSSALVGGRGVAA